MAMVLPDNIAERISDFVAGRRGFPFIRPDETMCLMYIYGKEKGIKDDEIKEVEELAKSTAEQMAADIDCYKNGSQTNLNPEYIRSKFLNRELQLAVEKKLVANRLAGDPAILIDCFAQHTAFYKKDLFFGLYGPLKESELTADIRTALSNRMVMVCYNKKDEQALDVHPLIPVYVWFKDRTK